MRTAIFGGSFDPPTKAHYAMLGELAARFDRVYVIPTYVSPFKADGATLNGETRLMLLERLFGSMDNVVVSDMELKSKGTSYSYVTAAKIREECGSRPYFVIGTDGLATLDKWARTDLLRENAIFYVVKRPYFPIKQSELSYARTFLDVEIAPFEGEEGSSSLLKAAVAFGKMREQVCDEVADYIEEHGLYRDYCHITDAYARFNVKPSRIEHIYRTAKAAILLAKKNGVDTDKAIRAALLHDIGKYTSAEELRAQGITVDERVERLAQPCKHQLIGAAIAKCVFDEDDEIVNAVATHCTGDKNMTVLQQIIFAADYIEEGRDFNGIASIRELTYRDLSQGMLAIYKNTIEYLTASGAEVSHETIEAYDALKAQEE